MYVIQTSSNRWKQVPPRDLENVIIKRTNLGKTQGWALSYNFYCHERSGEIEIRGLIFFAIDQC